MDPDEATPQRLIAAEFDRLGLQASDFPASGLAIGGGPEGVARFLRHVRTLQPGASWYDVFPDMPKHWIAGKPETWTDPYHPYGAYDYQALPSGPAIHVVHDLAVGEWGWVGALVAEARAAGWPVYGGGQVTSGASTLPGHAFIVLERGTPQDVTWAVADWIGERPHLQVAGVPRTGEEEYLS